MNTAAIRDKLYDYIRVADDKKIKAIYMMLEDEIAEETEWRNNAAFVEGQKTWQMTYKIELLPRARRELLEAVNAEITMASAMIFKGRLSGGMAFQFREGARIIRAGQIIEILNRKLNILPKE
jgi:hypothetical protein